ncbi:putative membrane protein YfcA [Sinorhizobium kostiense]|uniref:Membrane protein YfcA n=1 Tax=Sinorhizobium kostiense TaxID=76747 RepID=A0ABS4R1C0_9HYPH|nr:hypothetical protein [Sinorhizobium kostiense]MBP2236692.1 putative membrane protein YfcA [Sinorhizobium kostiense]
MKTLAAVLTALVAADFGAAASRYKRNALLWSAIALLLATAYVFALVAIALLLAQYFSPVTAAVGVALGLVVAALILVSVIAGLNARDRRLAEERRRRSLAKTNLALMAGTSLLRRQPLIALGTAIALGALLGLGTGRRRRERP